MKRLYAGLFTLALATLFGLMAQEVVKAQDDDITKIEYVGASKCRMCHNTTKSGKFFADWEDGPHANAFELLSDAEKKDPKCQKCHTTGFGMPGGFVSLEKTPKMAHVQCESCHGPGAKHVDSKGEIPAPLEIKAENCEKCHNPESPTWDPNRYVDAQGNKSGFIFEIAVQKVNHSAVLKELGKESRFSK